MTAGNPWLTLLITFVAGGGLAATITALFSGTSGRSKDGRDAEKDRVAIMDALWQQVRTATDEAANARRSAADQRRELDSMRLDIEGLLDRVEALEDSEHHLITYLTTLHDGINAGTIPPLPTPPPAIASILARARASKE